MKLRQYQIDAFASQVFEGNPAAVCPLDAWPDDAVMQSIAAENNLSETAFFVPTARGYRLRWFAPLGEVDLCGHATLASAYVLFELQGYPEQEVLFETRSGDLVVRRDGKRFSIDFPVQPPVPCVAPAALVEGLGRTPLEVLKAQDYIAVFENEEDIRSIKPDLMRLSALDLRGVCITAKGRGADFVSRFFGPKFGIPEDPVTGSVHCALAPYWQMKLGKTRLSVRQLSRRGGELGCEVSGARVILTGSAVKFAESTIEI
jgi:PhzF family phenazine biosynthesis protein